MASLVSEASSLKEQAVVSEQEHASLKREKEHFMTKLAMVEETASKDAATIQELENQVAKLKESIALSLPKNMSSTGREDALRKALDKAMEVKLDLNRKLDSANNDSIASIRKTQEAQAEAAVYKERVFEVEQELTK